jgi:hypothetical protein
MPIIHSITNHGMSISPCRPACAAVLLVLLSGCTSLQTQIEIDAPARDVRAVLYDFADYPKWNPFITKVDGTVAEGNHVYVTVKPAGKPEVEGDLTVTSMTDGLLSWRGVVMTGIDSGGISMTLPGVLSVKHDFIIEELGPDRTLVFDNDRLSGISVSFYDLGPIKAGLDAMNEALKRRAEGISK